MHVLITGAAGFLGKLLTETLMSHPILDGQAITQLTLVDRTSVPPPAITGGISVTTHALDVSDSQAVGELIEAGADVIFHLAAMVSSAAEADFRQGMTINFDATRLLLEACHAHQMSRTRFIMASSVAVYGGELSEVVEDDTALNPQSSYGTQKAMCELLINDYSRRGLIDGRVLRLPTIVIRPGRPNAAASSFASSILREPLNGQTAVCPVPLDLALFVMSPRRVIDALVHGAEVPGKDFGLSRSVMLPGITVSIADMLSTLEDVGGPEALDRVRHESDPRIEAIVTSWPSRFTTARAERLGFNGDNDFREIVDAFLAS